MPFAPEYQAGVALQYVSIWGIFIRGEGNWTGKTYFDSGNLYKQSDYMLLNARAGYKSEHLDFSFFINNILDEEYYTMGLDWGGGSEAVVPGAPRTFGVQATLEF